MPTVSLFSRLVAVPEQYSALAALADLAQALDTASEDQPLLFLHGPTGSGKTALIQGLVSEAGLAPERRICLLSANDFPLPPTIANPEPDTTEPENERSRLKEAKSCDLLIVEDLHHLPLRASEPLVQLLERRLQVRAPVVVTALYGPRHLTARGTPLPARLTTRLAAGLVLALEPWQEESRLLFLRTLAEKRGLSVGAELLAWLAQQLTGGGRQLEAALRQIETLGRLQRQPLSLSQAHDHFRSQIEPQRLTVQRIAEHVSGYFKVEPRQLKSERRLRCLLLPRQVSMYLARQLTPLSLQQIGAYFGGRDHTTVLHACQKVEVALQADVALSAVVRRLHAELG